MNQRKLLNLVRLSAFAFSTWLVSSACQATVVAPTATHPPSTVQGPAATQAIFPTLPPPWTKTSTAKPTATQPPTLTPTFTLTPSPSATFDMPAWLTARAEARQATQTAMPSLDPNAEQTTAEDAAERSPTPFPPQLRLGETVFQETAGEKGCQECHGSDGKGNEIGPDIRGAAVEDIKYQLEVNEEMQFDVSEEEIQAVASYLVWLDTQP